MRRLLISLLLLCTPWCVADDRVNVGILALVIPANQNLEALKLTPEKLKLIYLRKQLYWPSGKRIYPVNLQSENQLRLRFSQTVLGSLPAEQISYWNGMYFNGIRPPHVVNSEEAALRYVAQTEGSIAYVDACHTDDRVRAVLWLGHDGVMAKAPASLDCNVFGDMNNKPNR